MRICAPAQLYLGLSVLCILLGFVTKMLSANAVLMKLVFAGLWTWILSILCSKGMKELAWAFVMLPFVIIGSSMIYGGIHLVGREGLDVEVCKQSCEDNNAEDPDPVYLQKCKNECEGKEEGEE